MINKQITLSILLLALIFCSSLYGQQNSAEIENTQKSNNSIPAFERIGFKVGMNLSKLGGTFYPVEYGPGDLSNLYQNYDNKMGLIIGGFCKIKIDNKLYIRPEILFSRKGFKTSFGYDLYNDYVRGSGEFILDYLEFNGLIEYDLPSMGGMNFYLFTGPSLSIRVNVKDLVMAQYSTGYETQINYRLDEFSNKNDFGLVFGLGYIFKTRMAALEVRYTIGLTSVFNMEISPGIHDKPRNKVISFIFEYSLI